MASKLQLYSAVAERAAKDVTRGRGNWTGFLDTAARLYKYSFPDQLMIYAQHPDATACAPMETWNDSFNRWICRGAKGIALIDDTGSFPKLKYVFDVRDTEPSLHNSRPVHLWEMRQEHKAPVLDALAKTYDDVGDTLAESFRNIAKQLAREYYGDNAREIRYRAEDSFLEEFDDFNLGVTFENALSVSIAYTLMSRCGFDTEEYFDDDDFRSIFDFNTPDMVYALGTATSELSEQVLRDIEIVVKKYERQHTAERSVTNERKHDIQQGRGLSSSQSDTIGAAEGADRTARAVRKDEESVSERASDNDVQLHAPVGEAVPAPAGNGGSGEREAGTGDERPYREELAARQGGRPDGLDGGDERAESASRGNGLERANLRILENQAQGAAEEAAPLSMAELAHLHTDWNERLKNGVLHDEIVIDAAVNGDKEKTLTEIDTAIQRIRLKINQNIMDSTSIKNKIGYLTELDLYMFKDRKPTIREQLYDTVIRSDKYKERLAESETSPIQGAEEAVRQPPLPVFIADDSEITDVSAYKDYQNGDVIGYSANGFKYTVGRDGDFSNIIVDTFMTQAGEILGEEDIPTDIIKQIRLTNARKTEAETEPPPVLDGVSPAAETYFQLGNRLAEALSASSISLDEVDAILRDGGNGQNSVLRIAAYFSKGKTSEDNEEFLRREYLSGRYGHHSKADGKGFQFGSEQISIWFDETGITIGRGKTALHARDFALVTWEQAAARVGELFDAGQYVSHDVLDEALYNESVERADDIVEVYGNIQRGLGDIQYELRKAMDKEQQEAVKDDWKHRRYLISGLTALNDKADEALNGDASPEEIIDLYNETLRISEEIPQEWGFNNGHPDVVKQVAELLRDKGELSESEIKQGIGYSELSEYNLILTRLREDIAELKNEPDAPIHFYRNPHRLLSNLEIAGLPPKGFPVTEIPTLDAMPFITDDEVDLHLTRGSHFSEGKCRILSYFLHDHTPKERAAFIKREYGHGGGTWGDFKGWHNAEPGKGIELKRGDIFKPSDTVSLSWSKAAQRIGELIQSGRYMTRAELNRIPEYEEIMLARQINHFYYNMMDYERPFADNLDFHYPHEEEWAELRAFLGDTERIDAVLAEMQRIFVNTPEEDRFYKLRKEGFESLSAYREGTYTLFPNLDRLPDPELAVRRPASATRVRQSSPEIPPPPRSVEQLSLFGDEPALIADNPLPVLPSVTEQQAKIEQSNDKTAEVSAPAVSLPITRGDIDALLLGISNEDKARIAAIFGTAPRSREAAQLVREIYGRIEETMPRIDGADGYMGILGEQTGVAIVKGAPASTPERPPAETLSLPMTAVHKRVAELAADGRFAITEPSRAEQSVEPQMETRGESEEIPAPPVSYNIGDRLIYNGKPHEIDRIGDFVRLRNLGTPSAYPVFDHISILKNEFESMLADGELSILPPETPAPAPEFDFDTVTQTVLGRVMLDANYLHELAEAKSRGSLRTLCSATLDKVISDHEQDEPEIYNRYFSDDDFNDELYRHVLYQSWENRPGQEAVVAEQAAPEPDFDAVVRTAVERAMQDADYLHNLTEAESRASLRNPCAWTVEQSVRDHEQDEPAIYHKYFFDMEWRNRLLDSVLHQSWANRPTPEAAVGQEQPANDAAKEPQTVIPISAEVPSIDASLFDLVRQELDRRGFAVSEELIDTGFMEYDAQGGKGSFEDIADFIENEYLSDEEPAPEVVAEESASAIAEQSPPNAITEQPEASPLSAERGRSYSVGDTVYLENDKPFLIERIDGMGVYMRDPSLSYPILRSERRADFERMLSRNPKNQHFTDYILADLGEANGDLLDVLSNGLFSSEGKKTVLWLLGNNATNYELAVHLTDFFHIPPETMNLTTGETAEYSSTASGVFIDIPDKYNTKLSFSWSDVAPILRALEPQWSALRDAERAAASAEQPVPQAPGDDTKASYIVGQSVVLDLKERVGVETSIPNAGEFTVTKVNGDIVSVTIDNGKSGLEKSSITWDLTAAEVERYAVSPIAEKLLTELSPSGEETTAYYLFQYPNGLNAGAVLSHETLALIKERADAYVICAEACYLSESDMARYSIGFRKMPRDWNLLPDAVREQIRAVRPEYERQWQELYGELSGDNLPEQTELAQSNAIPSYEQYLRAKERYPDHITVTTTGDFNEIHELDAVFASGVCKYGVDFQDVNNRKIPLMRIPKQDIDTAMARLNELGRDVVYVNIYGAMAEYPHNDIEFIKKQLHVSDNSAEPRPIAAGTNFRITDDHLGEGGAKTKFRYNIDAINTLRDIERGNRSATPEEQEVLSRYVGWGGLPQAFDADNKQWTNEYLELSALLSPEEWESARASTLNAHYTSPTIIKAIYDTVERLGFKSGNMIDPGCGIGNFFGLLPDSMKSSKLYGVELDSLTARIAKQLYPKANIKETGFEQTDTPDAFFDLAIGNVPFGDYGVVDKRYDKHHFKIHDYFFAKALDQVRPGGVIAFITSKGTLDKKNPEVRKYIAQRAELLGAVRLPNTAFLKNAGTEVTSDIIFLQKRDRPLDIEPEWVHLGLTEDGIPVNQYFADNPEMMLGTMSNDDGVRMYGSADNTTCIPIEGADLAEQLKAALLNVRGQYAEPELDDIEGIDDHSIPAESNVKNFSYALVTAGYSETEGRIVAKKLGVGEVYFRENSLMYPVQLPAATLERIKGMIGLRDCVHRLMQLQLDEHSDDEIKDQQDELNYLYDRFTAEYGLINSQANSRAFNADSAYYLLCSLEVLDEDSNLKRKADMFTKRTIKQRTVITHVDTASEALAVSLGERACVDLEYMARLTGFSEEKLIKDLEGIIFLNIGGAQNHRQMYVTADEYLSGNVREKLKMVQAAAKTVGDGSLDSNVRALEAAQPKDLDASEIAVRLGATWIAPEYVQQFMYELLDTSWRMQDVYQVKYHEFTGEWQITGKGRAQYNDIHATVTYGTGRMNAYEIICDTLNLRDVRVYDYKEDADGKEKRVLNKKETTLAQQKQEQIKQAFKDWIWQDPQRRQTLVRQYNERFNSVRPREYDGKHITFSGISPEIVLMPHQLNAIAHILYGGNTLLAHEVGAGKTFEMVAAAMESKRLGLCNKSLFAVPNHIIDQIAGDFLRLYPSANILVAKKKDFEMRNRRKFCAKIATGDYDAVIVGHSQLEKIPMSRERQERLLNEQLCEIEDGIDELKRSGGERFSIKQLERTKKSLEIRLKKLLDGKTRDDVVTFEQLGVDRLFVDEAHGFKNLFLYTKMRNVAGLSTTEAQKSSDLFLKCRYMDELTDNKGVIFATGTPISNSMTEMYTMQRYLQYDTLAAKNLTHFDCWASIFGETQTSIELAPEGTGYRARTRFAKFHNLPELMCMFKEVADIKTADMLDLPVPEAKYETIIVEPSELQKEMVQELSERAAAVHSRLVEPNVDNMLKITTDGRKIGLDQRLINPLLPDFEGSKVNACTDNVFRIWDETKSGRLTQLVFCDFSTPNKDGRFNIYDDIKAKLIERGIPEHEIAFIHDADTDTRKKELFAKVRQGKVRVLFGSTFKMGAGTNVQDKLIAIHDADCPWRPADLEQRAGRIVRQGNNNSEVHIFRYATSGTFDSYLWQTVESKQKFIAQIMSSKSPVRSCEDVDETALSYAEIKALCAGNPLIKEKMDLDIEVARLRLLKADHQSQRFRLEDDLLKHYPEQITAVTERISGIEKDIAIYAEQKEKSVDLQPSLTGGAVSVSAKFPGMTVNGVEYTEKEPAAKALLEACKGVTDKSDLPVGSYMGFDMSLRLNNFGKQINLLLRGNMTYQVELSTDTFGNLTRMNNALADLPKRLEGAKSQLDTLTSQQEAARLELEKPFTLAEELAEKEARLALLNADLNIDGNGDLDVENDADERAETESMAADGYRDRYGSQAASFKSAKPSLIDGIRSFNPDRQAGAPVRKSTERDI